MRYATLDEIIERETLERLRAFKWNKARAADSLGITVKTLYNRLAVMGWTKAEGLNGEGKGFPKYAISPSHGTDAEELDRMIQDDRNEADQSRIQIDREKGQISLHAGQGSGEIRLAKPIKGEDEENE